MLNCRYDLTDEEMRAISRGIEAPAGVRSSDRFFCVQVPGDDEARSNVARTLECRVFDAVFGNDAEELTAEFCKYEDISRFLLVVDRRTGLPAGVVRLIVGRGPRGPLKTVDDLGPNVGVSPEKLLRGIDAPDLEGVVDIATLAVDRSYRGSVRGSQLVILLLMRAIYLFVIHHQVRHLVAILDARARQSLRGFGFTLDDPLSIGPFEYCGSPASHLVHLSGPGLFDSPRRRLGELRHAVRDRLRLQRRPSGLVDDLRVARKISVLVTGRRLDRCIESVTDEPVIGGPAAGASVAEPCAGEPNVRPVSPT